ncbi:MAG: GTPase HflX [Bacillota bacterium]|nr:GTPase HflX [Bacillota bacterium]
MEQSKSEKAILVGLKLKQSAYDFDSSFAELGGLVEAAGGTVIAEIVQPRERPLAATYIGKGKVQEVAHLIEELEPDLVVFDNELSPVQQRNLEAALEIRVVDRSMLILDIFSMRARSREGKLQVELARLEYRLPRLTGFGKEMSRLGGGIGTRGAGEQKLELDKRHIRDRIKEIKRQLEKVQATRQNQKKQRQRAGLQVVSLVGYTNAGKSTLFNRLCTTGHRSGQAQVDADARLFQTLDTTTRRIKLSSGNEVLLSDSVGFIQNLPHHLVAAFRSTLEEVVEADLLLHVVDASDHNYLEKMQVVEKVLFDLGADAEKVLTVFNKVDKLDIFPGQGCYVSAETGEGLECLLDQLERIIL